MAMGFISKTLFVDNWDRAFSGDPEVKQLEREERERKELLAQYEANKKKLSQGAHCIYDVGLHRQLSWTR